jgi:hypothetical protein
MEEVRSLEKGRKDVANNRQEKDPDYSSSARDLWRGTYVRRTRKSDEGAPN